MEKERGWINIYKNWYDGKFETEPTVFDSYWEAQKAIYDESGYVTTIQIEFYDTTTEED